MIATLAAPGMPTSAATCLPPVPPDQRSSLQPGTDPPCTTGLPRALLQPSRRSVSPAPRRGRTARPCTEPMRAHTEEPLHSAYPKAGPVRSLWPRRLPATSRRSPGRIRPRLLPESPPPASAISSCTAGHQPRPFDRRQPVEIPASITLDQHQPAADHLRRELRLRHQCLPCLSEANPRHLLPAPLLQVRLSRSRNREHPPRARKALRRPRKRPAPRWRVHDTDRTCAAATCSSRAASSRAGPRTHA